MTQEFVTLRREVVEQALEAFDSAKVWKTLNLHKLKAPHVSDAAAALRTALEQPDVRIRTSVPANWKLVPVEPAPAMLRAAIDAPRPAVYVDSLSAAENLINSTKYRAMLAAAPQPPATQRGTAAPNARSSQVIDALTSYCNTGEIDGADDLLAELLFERDHPPAVERPNVDPCKDGSCDCCWTDKPQPQGEQDSVAVVSIVIDGSRTTIDAAWNDRLAELPAGTHNLYTSPQPKRHPLTDNEVMNMIPPCDSWKYDVGHEEAIRFARAIEAAHNIK